MSKSELKTDSEIFKDGNIDLADQLLVFSDFQAFDLLRLEGRLISDFVTGDYVQLERVS